MALCLTAWVGTPVAAFAQGAATGPVTLNDAVQLALKNYPALKESRAREQAAEQTIGVARTAYLPRLDVLWQTNRATTNNVFGLVLPQGIVPPISGPVLGTTSNNTVWGSAAGMLLSWQAVDFGLRRANVDAARAQTLLSSAQTALSELDVAAAAADAYLTVLASDETVRAARANVDRLQVFADSVRILVQNQLRPGADQSRAEAELAIAKNELSQAIQAAEIARATLANAIGSHRMPDQLTGRHGRTGTHRIVGRHRHDRAGRGLQLNLRRREHRARWVNDGAGDGLPAGLGLHGLHGDCDRARYGQPKRRARHRMILESAYARGNPSAVRCLRFLAAGSESCMKTPDFVPFSQSSCRSDML